MIKKKNNEMHNFLKELLLDYAEVICMLLAEEYCTTVSCLIKLPYELWVTIFRKTKLPTDLQTRLDPKKEAKFLFLFFSFPYLNIAKKNGENIEQHSSTNVDSILSVKETPKKVDKIIHDIRFIDFGISSKSMAFSNVIAAVNRYKIRKHQIQALIEAAQNLYKEMKLSNVFNLCKDNSDWGNANLAGMILGGSVQKGTAIADSYNGNVVFLLSVPHNTLQMASHSIIENMVYRPFFLGLVALVKQIAQKISKEGYRVEHEYIIGESPYVTIVWKNIQFDVLVAFNCLQSSIELGDILIREDNLNETVKKFINPTIDNNYLDLLKNINGSDLTTKKLLQVNLSNWNSILS
ncbi:hypothetical protein RFI_32459, partial [Reticulomyxa filosa]